jgi:hypothetical protein
VVSIGVAIFIYSEPLPAGPRVKFFDYFNLRKIDTQAA